MSVLRRTFALAVMLAWTAANAAPPILATLALGNDTQGIATDPSLAKAYVTNFASGTVSVIDINSLTVSATIAVGPNPRRVIVNAATHRVYVTSDNAPGSLIVIDGTADRIVASVTVGNNPRELGSNFFIDEVYVSNYTGNSVTVVNTESNTVVATIPVGSAPTGAASNDVLRKVYVPNSTGATVSVIDARTHMAIKSISVGRLPLTATFDAEHGKVYVNNATDKTLSVIDCATDTVSATIAIGTAGTDATIQFAALSPVYHRAYLPSAGDNTLIILDTDTDEVANTSTVGASPVDALVDANGGNVYVTNQGAHSVSVLNAVTETAVDTLSVGNAPWRAISVLNHLLVLNTNGPNPDSVTISAGENTLANTTIATEFYEADFDHYFHSAGEVETRLLLDGIFGEAWQRTFDFWRVWTAPAAGRFPVCRFFTTSFGARSSHFYTPYASECQSLRTTPSLASVWQLESAAVYYLALPDANGGCPVNTAPLYRVYNAGMGGAPNHRYLADRDLRAQMVTRGWVAEGSGPDAVFACTPTLLNG